MTSLFRVLATAIAVLLLVASGCKQTAEGQSKAWKSNVTTVQGLMAEYPGMKPALEARLSAATQVHEAAASLEGEPQIEKLSQANGTLMKGFVRDLQGLEASMKKLREARVEVTAKAGDDSSRAGAKVAADDANAALTRAEATLKQGAANEADAAAVLSKIVSDLETAQSALDKVSQIDGEKKADAKAKQDAKAQADAEAKAAVADWKCEYCGSANEHSHKECSGCGAPRGGKKDPKAPAAK